MAARQSFDGLMEKLQVSRLQDRAAQLHTDLDRVLRVGLATLLHRYTGQEVVHIAAGGSSLDSSLTYRPDSTLRTLLESMCESDRPSPILFGVNMSAHTLKDRPEHALMVGLTEEEDRLKWHLRFDPAHLDAELLQRAMTHYAVLLDSLTTAPDAAVGHLGLLSEAERETMLTRWNDTTVPVEERCIHEHFQLTAAAAPDAPALIQDDLLHTFGMVNAEANRLAHFLAGYGVASGIQVGICLERSPELLVAMLGVMKAGAAYVPIDPEQPTQRMREMVTAADCLLTLTRGHLMSPADFAETQVLVWDEVRDQIATQPTRNPTAPVSPTDLCYVIFTSGSSGNPKPIAIRHRGVYNNLLDLNDLLAIGEHDRIVNVSSQGFDMSVYELLGLCLNGGAVVLPSVGRQRDLAHLVDLLRRHAVTVWSSTPSLLGAILNDLDYRGDDGTLPIRFFMIAGDWIPTDLPDRARRRAPGAAFVALGGATEASVYSTYFQVGAVDPAWTSIPYGVPMRNQRAYILDKNDQPVPCGVAGELHLAGMGLAQGYFRRPDLTAERFIDWSFGSTAERLYRTGDLARYRSDGGIELLGRLDFQVKINGIRVELGEVEKALRGLTGVREAVVVVRQAGATARLVGYVVPEADAVVDPDVLRADLMRVLPRYMVPGAIAILPELPLNMHGKLDRNLLPVPEAERSEFAASMDETEQRIAAVFEELLDVESLARNASLIELGADSMIMLQAMSRIDSHLDWQDMLESPTIAELAERLRTGPASRGVSR
ncbi:non-ribosomal peptide synthetase [Micromonospora sp. NPDC051196]|uniref:non-ribosomal peptide synthetase n=1 Tax=Micromonospora sp. NPDC051196 TaxID=3155281 RepID=UPI00341D22BD